MPIYEQRGRQKCTNNLCAAQNNIYQQVNTNWPIENNQQLTASVQAALIFSLEQSRGRRKRKEIARKWNKIMRIKCQII